MKNVPIRVFPVVQKNIILISLLIWIKLVYSAYAQSKVSHARSDKNAAKNILKPIKIKLDTGKLTGEGSIYSTTGSVVGI